MNQVYNTYSHDRRRVVLTERHLTLDSGASLGPCPGKTELLSVITGRLTVQFEDGQSLTLNSGDAFLFDSANAHTTVAAEPTELFALQFFLNDYINNQYLIFDKPLLNAFFIALPTLREKLYRLSAHAKRVQELCYAIENEFENADLCSNAVTRAHVLLALSFAMQYYQGDTDEVKLNKTQQYPRIEAAIRYMEEHIEEDLELDTLAQVAGMGKTYFSTTFKQVTGLTVWEYLLNARVELAMGYLIEKNAAYTITEIAVKCGFNSSAYFNKIFKKFTGKTPSEFKRYSENTCF